MVKKKQRTKQKSDANRSEQPGRARVNPSCARRSPGRLKSALADPRCPPVGTVMKRTVHTRAGEEVTCVCKVTKEGFLYEGEFYDTPTPVATRFAREVIGQAPGSRRAGFQFFFPHADVPRLKKPWPRTRRKAPRAASQDSADGSAGSVSGPDTSSVRQAEAGASVAS